MGLNIQDLAVASPDIDQGGRIEARFTADGGNEVPQIVVSGVPADAVELALIVHDPDAPLPHGFTHWVRYGIPATDGVIAVSGEEGPHRDGTNSAGEQGWMGPQPPAGHGDHHYYFWVYALDTPVEGTPSREEFLDRYGDHVIEQNRLVGIYST